MSAASDSEWLKRWKSTDEKNIQMHIQEKKSRRKLKCKETIREEEVRIQSSCRASDRPTENNICQGQDFAAQVLSASFKSNW